MSRQRPKTQRRLLLVEDDRATSKALSALLRHRGWDVIVAPTIAAAMLHLETVPDCIILDLMLPDGAGEAVLKAVRQRRLAARVVVTTGCSDQWRLQMLHDLRPHAVLTKPVDLTRLCRTIEDDTAAS